MQEEKRRERSFVEHEVGGLIQRATERFARARGLPKASVSEDDITELFRDELRVEPVSETEEHLVYEFHASNKFGMSPCAEEDDGRLQDGIHDRVEFVGVAETKDNRSKFSYRGQVVGGHCKMLKARIDKDYKLRIYLSPPVKTGFGILTDPLVAGAMFGAVVGGGFGLIFFSHVSRVAAGTLIGSAAGGACGFGFRQQKREYFITGYDIFSCFGEDDHHLWKVEGRYICRKFEYTYQHLEEAVTLDEMGNQY